MYLLGVMLPILGVKLPENWNVGARMSPGQNAQDKTPQDKSLKKNKMPQTSEYKVAT